MIAAAANHNFARLFDFDGRTPRELFLPFAHAVTGGVALGIVLLALPMMGTFSSAPGGGSGGNVRLIVVGLLLLVFAANFLLAAATVRRLHDVGRSGWWFGAVPASVGLTFLSFLVAAQGFGANLGIALAMRLVASLLFLAAPAQLFLLRLRGDAGTNRYGPPFVREEPALADGPGYQVERVDARIAALLAERAAKKPQLSRPVAAPGFGRRRPPASTDS
ncbi:MAG TPA: DUF805 domain-containing protein [Allosphingosinicella sp.]|nr:DUF805 domain-containing protein [Allosphingosinicella sp.]